MGVPAVIVTLNHLECLPENLSYFIRNSDSLHGDTQIQPVRFIRRHDNGACFDYFRQMAVLSGLFRLRLFFLGVYTWLVKVLGQFSIIYFGGLGLRIGVRVWVRVRVGLGFGLGLELGLGLGLVWCYGQGKFRVRVRIRVRVGFGLGL